MANRKKYLNKWTTFDFTDCYFFTEINIVGETKSSYVYAIMWEEDKDKIKFLHKTVENFEESVDQLEFLGTEKAQELYKRVITEVWEKWDSKK
jgi:hypothetical protein